MLTAGKTLSSALAGLRFPSPVAHVYDPLQYAWAPYEVYLTRYCASRKRVVLLGMNPGSFRMMQTGVPFGEVERCVIGSALQSRSRGRRSNIPGGRSKGSPATDPK